MDCTTPEKLCRDCKPIYQNLLLAYGPYQLDLPPGYYPVLFTITLPPRSNLKFVDTMGKAIENTLALSYGMVNAKVWKIVFYEGGDGEGMDADKGSDKEKGKEEDKDNGKGKEKEKKKEKEPPKPATLKLLIDFPHKIKVMDDMRSGIFLQFPIPKGASEWKMHLPEEAGADGKPGHESLARLRFWKEVDELFTAKRILNKDMRK
ncbi:hypothetical protein ASPCAL10140 [Aspergillus calidoustus]|uniref:Uncharacterized protein n=1 Tax=Aspergillus calidoustus TaxID=454130 RepID=A0A0U5G7Q6_ASPCI|nr:hypothetical protein ASPCAL10140 [Aspergillus calidoustus]